MCFKHAIIGYDKNLQNEHPNWDILPTQWKKYIFFKGSSINNDVVVYC